MSKSKYIPRHGDVVRLDFNPQTGHEQAGRRPAIVQSPTEYNRTVGLAVVCPITNATKGYPWEVAIPKNPYVSGVVLANQVKSVAWRQRRAEFICISVDGLLDDVVERTIALLSPEDGDE